MYSAASQNEGNLLHAGEAKPGGALFLLLVCFSPVLWVTPLALRPGGLPLRFGFWTCIAADSTNQAKCERDFSPFQDYSRQKSAYLLMSLPYELY